ncbi:methyl-accepting chemotaxis protein [Rhodopila sp.]|uniref:methyl-accepting chemotaxis protein n=1 Tax=Rhodopila sp. TaxID=2480087 RepID=UPI003D0B364E
MFEFSGILRHRANRVGIVPRLLMASILAVVVAVAVVQTWTLHVIGQSERDSAQVRLALNLAVLKEALLPYGSDWHLSDDGKLMQGSQVVSGLDRLVEDVGNITHGVVTVFAGDTRIATTVPRPGGGRATGTKLAAGPAYDAVISHGKSYRGTANILGVSYFTVYEPLRDMAGKQVGILFVGVASATVQDVVDKIIWHGSVAALVVILVVGAVGWSILRATMRPLRQLAGSVGMISDGHLDLPVPCADRTDQLGEIGRAVEMLRLKAQRAQILETQAAADHEAGVRRQIAQDQVTRDFSKSVSGVLTGLVGSAENMRKAAGETVEAAEATHKDMAATVSDAEQSSHNLSRVAAATEQLTASVSEIFRQVNQASQAAEDAVHQARATDTTMHSLSEAAGQIGAVVALINSIAGQTNLLALNATIEAARAGEAGKGFAVVASEVKQLATQTAQATQQIGVQVAAIQTATGEVAGAVHKVTEAIGRVSDVATAIATAVEEQGSATREIATQVNEVAQATNKATRAMLDASSTAERSGQSSQAVLAVADQVMRMSGTLREEVDHFSTAMNASQQSGERRNYERISGRGAKAHLRTATNDPAAATVINISLGGIAVGCDWLCDDGTEILLRLPGGGAEVSSRVVGVRDHVMALAFRQDPGESLECLMRCAG